jgi:hypothetical protein
MFLRLSIHLVCQVRRAQAAVNVQTNPMSTLTLVEVPPIYLPLRIKINGMRTPTKEVHLAHHIYPQRIPLRPQVCLLDLSRNLGHGAWTGALSVIAEMKESGMKLSKLRKDRPRPRDKPVQSPYFRRDPRNLPGSLIPRLPL